MDLRLLAYRELSPADKIIVDRLIKSGAIEPVVQVRPPPERLTNPNLHHRRLAQAVRDANPIYANVPRLEGTGRVRKIRNQNAYGVYILGKLHSVHDTRSKAKCCL